MGGTGGLAGFKAAKVGELHIWEQACGVHEQGYDVFSRGNDSRTV